MKIFKGKKVKVMDAVKNGITPALVGAGLSVVDDMMADPTKPETSETIGIAALIGGIVIPAVVPGTSGIGASAAAVGAFMTSKNMGLAGKLGLTEAATTTGLSDRSALGNAQRMFVNKQDAERRPSGAAPKAPNPLG